MTGTFYIIATPIGNLGDMTMRALETISGLDLLMCEDTRVTKKLLSAFDIHVPVDSYREEVHHKKRDVVLGFLREGKDVGLVSDAGTPVISDPGARLIADVLTALPEIRVVPVPGASAVTTALSASGLRADRFVFLGFPPHKKGRDAFFDDAMAYGDTVVLYESTHRIMKTMQAIDTRDPRRHLCVAREVTKLHETFYRGTAGEVIAMLETSSIRGEFVIMIAGTKSRR